MAVLISTIEITPEEIRITLYKEKGIKEIAATLLCNFNLENIVRFGS
jgi:hypothetical protein